MISFQDVREQFNENRLGTINHFERSLKNKIANSMFLKKNTMLGYFTTVFQFSFELIRRMVCNPYDGLQNLVL